MKNHSASNPSHGRIPSGFERNATPKESEQPVGATITPQDAKSALDGDIANIQKRVAAGRSLTGRQRALLMGIAGGINPLNGTPAFTHNIADLAQSIDVARATVHRWLELPNNPGRRPDGRYSVTEWLAFKATRPAGGGGSETIAERRRNLELKNQKLEWEIAELTKAYVPVTDVQNWCAELVNMVQQVISRIPMVAPEVIAVTVPEAESRLKHLEDEILTRLHRMGNG